jgi:hypothetical protein
MVRQPLSQISGSESRVRDADDISAESSCMLEKKRSLGNTKTQKAKLDLAFTLKHDGIINDDIEGEDED